MNGQVLLTRDTYSLRQEGWTRGQSIDLKGTTRFGKSKSHPSSIWYSINVLLALFLQLPVFTEELPWTSKSYSKCPTPSN
ncbi:hypothetical protein D5086_012818 [Populus alba]|uniref:Uncharacterized protein n=1 Tax=Populus alba TaxID=43335 RepID=A0ACC4C408_POPAL